jgi:hypothetical protein
MTIFFPPLADLDATYGALISAGCSQLRLDISLKRNAD